MGARCNNGWTILAAAQSCRQGTERFVLNARPTPTLMWRRPVRTKTRRLRPTATTSTQETCMNSSLSKESSWCTFTSLQSFDHSTFGQVEGSKGNIVGLVKQTDRQVVHREANNLKLWWKFDSCFDVPELYILYAWMVREGQLWVDIFDSC